jgi:hypothetical protein
MLALLAAGTGPPLCANFHPEMLSKLQQPTKGDWHELLFSNMEGLNYRQFGPFRYCLNDSLQRA